ncbi:AfsR/SARP family transcriptional regulator [Streptomyces sp. QHH-9511]|uniref:AfsR/SARP family transcriptional regulator n=1 Tax=Streptomyces sp. QHH-9511 TaxID=2684468 RepID=UPI001319AA1F|nr:AfsR/SARP family transcriptional regulator [Streptomyces sp. QHH-9511]
MIPGSRRIGPVRYSVLGPARAHTADGRPVTVGGARLRALLTALALRAGRTVPVAVLVDEVWDGEPPADGPAALQALVGRLRRALGREAVVSAPGGYRLAAVPDDVDAHRFERLVQEGVRRLGAGDPARAAALLDGALGLWRGPALADLPDRAVEAARWDARRLDARRARLEASLALGEASTALPDLAALCEAHPLDEPLHALRLRALRDTGRSAEALLSYESLRRALATRLGTTPSPALQSLHRELLSPRGSQVSPRGPQEAPPGVGPAAPGADGAVLGLGPAASGADGAVLGLGPETSGADGAALGPHEAPAAERAGSGPASAGPSPYGAAPGPNRAGPSPRTESGPAPARSGAGPAVSGPGPSGSGVDAAGPGRGSAPGAGPAAPSAAPVPLPGNLRVRLTSFVGREGDIAALRDDLRGARLVTLIGPGGAGKTRLSQEAAESAAEGGGWPDGVWLAELAPVGDPEAVVEAVLGAVGARQTVLRGAGAEELRGSDDPLGRLVEHCAGRRMLLLLDNCEHVVGAAARLAEHLLARCPGVTVLATSREPLGVPGESVRPLGPLPRDTALRLLAERGAAARAGFRIEDDPEAADEICRRLDGLPLAIELAAARLRMLSPRQIADRLDDRFRLLTSGARTVLPRQQTLRAVVDWSWDLLDKPERAVLRRLSVFTGGCDLEAAEAVCSATATATPTATDVLDALGSLVDKSLVVAAPSDDGAMRYRLLETVAEYAAERLDEAGERAAFERRHLVHYREVARLTDPELRGGRQAAAMARFRIEYENLRTALRRAVAARDEHEGLSLVHSLLWYWQMHDLRADALHWAEAVAALGPDPFASQAPPVVPLHEPCTAAPPPLTEDQLWEARRGVRLLELLNMDYQTGRWTAPEGVARLRRITTVYRPGLPQACRLPGAFSVFAVLLTGDVDGTRAALAATVEACRAHGYDWELGYILQLRANMLANRADSAGAASADADESLRIFVRLGDAWGAAEALSSRGEAREKRCDFEGAAEDFAAAIGYARRIGARSQTTLLRTRYADMLTVTGREEEGEAILREVLEAGHPGYEPMLAARIFLAVLLGRTGRTAEAREHLDILLSEFGSVTLAIFEGFTLGSLAWLENLDGRYAAALPLVRQALERAKGALSMAVAPQMPAIHLVTAAWALAGLGGPHATVAARLLGAQESHLPPGHLRAPLERENLARAIELTRTALGDDAAFEAAYAEGGGISLEEATALLDGADAIRRRAESS